MSDPSGGPCSAAASGRRSSISPPNDCDCVPNGCHQLPRTAVWPQPPSTTPPKPTHHGTLRVRHPLGWIEWGIGRRAHRLGEWHEGALLGPAEDRPAQTVRDHQCDKRPTPQTLFATRDDLCTSPTTGQLSSKRLCKNTEVYLAHIKRPHECSDPNDSLPAEVMVSVFWAEMHQTACAVLPQALHAHCRRTSLRRRK